jgi:hypothetical protein
MDVVVGDIRLKLCTFTPVPTFVRVGASYTYILHVPPASTIADRWASLFPDILTRSSAEALLAIEDQ